MVQVKLPTPNGGRTTGSAQWTCPPFGGIIEHMTRVVGLTLAVASLMCAWLAAAQEQRPLPDHAAFLAAAKEKLASDERLQVRYTYKLRRTEMGRNPFGRIGTGDTNFYEVYPSPVLELTYYRHIATNGVPVSERDLAGQDRRQRAKVDDYVRRLMGESARDRQRRLDQDSVVGEREQRMVEDVVATLDYRLERRDTLDGRPTIIVAFAPKPGARPWTGEGRLVKHFKGRVWIEEHEKQIMRVEAEAIDTISFGLGFVARIYQGTKGVFTRRQMPDGVWLPAGARLTGTGRAMWFRRFDIDFASEYFDYQPIDPASPPPFVALPDGVIKN